MTRERQTETIHVLMTEADAADVVPIVTRVLEQHDGSLIQNMDTERDLTTGQACRAVILFPPGTRRYQTASQRGTDLSEIVFPDGYRVQAVEEGGTVQLCFPREDIPLEYQQRIPCYCHKQQPADRDE